jgi:hypothetical protein
VRAAIAPGGLPGRLPPGRAITGDWAAGPAEPGRSGCRHSRGRGLGQGAAMAARLTGRTRPRAAEAAAAPTEGR